MQTTNPFISRESFRFIKGKVELDRRNGRRRPTVRIRNKTEPENRLWKLSTGTASHKGCKLEFIVFLFFGSLVSAAAVFCGTELFQVVNGGALEQTVQVLLSSAR
jgi:hypothetical protein